MTAILPSELKPGVRSASTSTHSPTDRKLRFVVISDIVLGCVWNIFTSIWSRNFSATIVLKLDARIFVLIVPFIPFAAPLFRCSTSFDCFASSIARKDFPKSVVSFHVARTLSMVWTPTAIAFPLRPLGFFLRFALQFWVRQQRHLPSPILFYA
jgi:hypothetical protein